MCCRAFLVTTVYNKCHTPDTVVKAVDAGATVAMEKQPISETSWWAVIVDPDGNSIGLHKGVTDAG